MGDALPIPRSLYLVHLRVSATSGQQLVVRTLLHDPTRVEEDDPVGQTGTAQTSLFIWYLVSQQSATNRSFGQTPDREPPELRRVAINAGIGEVRGHSTHPTVTREAPEM